MNNRFKGLPKRIQRELRAEYEKARRRNLRLTIEELYEHHSPEHIDAEASQYEASAMAMIEVQKVGIEFHDILDMDLDHEMKDVVFPAEVAAILKKGDVFLATLGFCDEHWFVIWLSPPYDTMPW
jgi:hypothetical protein